MGFFSDLFGGGKKTDFGKIYPEPPKLRVDDADVFLQQIDDLIGEYESVKSGDNMFDAIRFIYEPQKAELDRLYGIGTQAGDTYGAKSGALQELQNNLNKRGLLDSGTSGLLESQVYADRNRQLADLFGGAKEVQRDDYFNSLANLERLFPQRFEVRNIPNTVNYMNDINSYNVATQRNAATEGDRLMRAAQSAGKWASIFNAGGQFPTITGALFQNTADGYNNRAGLFGSGNLSGGGGLSNQSPFGFGGGQINNRPYSSGSSAIPGVPDYYNAPGASAMNTPFPTTSNKSSLVSKQSPGMSGGMDFSSLIKLALAGPSGGASMFA